jgi:hypothetical protein
MAYIEAFLLYITAVVFMFIVLFGGVVFLYMLFGQLKLFFSIEDVTFQREKEFLYKLIKNRFFKLTILVYFIAFGVFYVKESMTYYGKDRAYPQAKSYAIVGDFVYFWHSVGVNIRMKADFEKYYRLVNYHNTLDNKIQKVQSFILDKMYQYIPQEDGEREFWFYKYKQLYIAKTRYIPGDSFPPSQELTTIMDNLYDTSYKLYNKSFKDKVINNERYIFIAQPSYYLINNMSFYATYNVRNGLDRLFVFMEHKNLFQRNIEYAHLLYDVYKKYKSDKGVAKAFNNNPYSLGMLYSGVVYAYDHYITYNSHNNINPCTSKEIKIFLNTVEDFYYWIFRDPNSSFHKLSQGEKKQIRWLYNSTALSFSYKVATYICELPLNYKDNRIIFKYDNESYVLPVYKNREDLWWETATLNDFIKFSKLESLLQKREEKNQKSNQKDK